MASSETFSRPILYHIPVCPFSQRLEVLLELKGIREAVEFHVIDITRPRPDWLLALTGGSTALPVMKVGEAKALKESMVLLRYLEARYPTPTIQRQDPFEAALENLMATMADSFCNAGYRLVLNQDQSRRQDLHSDLLREYRGLNDFLQQHSPDGVYLFDEFGFAEVVFTPFFMRFWFNEYYEDFSLPDTEDFARVRRWIDACLQHPAAQQVRKEEIVKLYYDYARGIGNGGLLPGRAVSSFAFEPHWSKRPWPPKDKYNHHASDQELGLLS